jgi:pilus assembly protein TadC
MSRHHAGTPGTDPRAVVVAADLMAACLDAGCSEVEALQAVAAALGERAGHRFAQVAGALRMGLPAEDAWRPLADDPVTAPLAQAACRVVRTGAPLAGAVGLVADDVRALRRSKARDAVRRAGVTAMAPLGGCFLPAFLILAIVPVIAGLIGHLTH